MKHRLPELDSFSDMVINNINVLRSRQRHWMIKQSQGRCIDNAYRNGVRPQSTWCCRYVHIMNSLCYFPCSYVFAYCSRSTHCWLLNRCPCYATWPTRAHFTTYPVIERRVVARAAESASQYAPKGRDSSFLPRCNPYPSVIFKHLIISNTCKVPCL
jgi:hypothetical protein